ncbi:unnamed protein product [Ectocarpus sp. 6 AP-2014]
MREQPFLDNPTKYPEFSLLIKRHELQHAFRWGLHRHRTVALLALAACSANFSGAAAPSADFETSAASTVVDEWTAFLTKGLALDLLVRHFEGIGKALACMFVMALVATLAYPLHLLITRPPSAVPAGGAGTGQAESERCSPGSQQRQLSSLSSSSPSLPLLSALVVASTTLPIWALAVWGSVNLDWGLASGLSVGLSSACLSLKNASFAQSWCCFNAPVTTAKEAAEAMGAPSGGEKRPREDVCGDGDLAGPPLLTFGEFLFFILAAPFLVCEPEFLRERARRAPCPGRAFSEFSHAVLVFVALHAACSAFFAPVMRVVAAAVFSPPSPSLVAESAQAALASDFRGCGSGDGEHTCGGSPFNGATIGWVDCVGWAGAEGIHTAGGSGGWFFSLLLDGGGSETAATSYFESLFCGGAGGAGLAWWWGIAAASALAMLVFSPMVHFMAFYGFWHCVCLGCAELWGYPDRNFYGPWWLLAEEPDTMYRLWSTPVHRWVSSCIYRPIVGHKSAAFSQPGRSGGGVRRGLAGTSCRESEEHQQQGGYAEEKKQQQQQQQQQRRWTWRRLLALTSAFLFSSLVHEAVTFVAMRRTCWPVSTFSLVLSIFVISGWDAMYPVRSIISESAAVSGASGEDSFDRHGTRPPAEPAVLPSSSAATRSQPGATATAAGVSCGSTVVETSDGTLADHSAKSYVVVDHARDLGEQHAITSKNGSDSCGTGGGGGVDGAGRVSNTKKAGREWRGWGAVAFFEGASLVMGLAVDFLMWQWWRHTLLYEP